MNLELCLRYLLLIKRVYNLPTFQLSIECNAVKLNTNTLCNTTLYHTMVQQDNSSTESTIERGKYRCRQLRKIIELPLDFLHNVST